MVMLLHAANLNEFFREVLSDLQCQEDTQAYIIGIFGKYRTATYDLSHYSVGALFAQARSNHSFFDYQSLGDFIFWQSTVNPENFQHASKDYYDTIAQLSYDACYQLINRQWKLYQELADALPQLEDQVKHRLTTISKESVLLEPNIFLCDD